MLAIANGENQYAMEIKVLQEVSITDDIFPFIFIKKSKKSHQSCFKKSIK
jgi:hypothetical protein